MSVVDLLTDAGLGGRGGADFPTALKVAAGFESRADVVVNACDGEIGAVKDAHVVGHHLDELLRGAALVTPSRRRTVYAAHRGSDTARRLHAAGLDVLEVPHRYVSSEASALVSALHGGLARPMTKHRPLVYGGRDGDGRRIRPTNVLNAETVWRIAQIEALGPAWFRALGTASEPGPRLVSVGGHVDSPGVVESAAGVPLSDLLDAAGVRRDTAHVVVGGLGGVVLTSDEALRTAWSAQGLAAFGGSIGAGVVTALDPAECPLEAVGRYITYGAGESAGQCGPCMFGLPAVAMDWAHLTRRPADREVVERLRARLGLVSGRGACRHPDGVARFAASALRAVGEHLHAHATAHSAGPCTNTTNVPEGFTHAC